MNIKKYVSLFICCVSCTIVCASKYPLASKDNQAYDAVTFLGKYNDDNFDLYSKPENSQLS
jgi:hypothetical protein